MIWTIVAANFVVDPKSLGTVSGGERLVLVMCSTVTGKVEPMPIDSFSLELYQNSTVLVDRMGEWMVNRPNVTMPRIQNGTYRIKVTTDAFTEWSVPFQVKTAQVEDQKYSISSSSLLFSWISLLTIALF